MLPSGYGVAWHDAFRRVAICYPVPLNRIFGLARRTYCDLRYPPRGGHCQRLKDRVAALEGALNAAQEERRQNRELVAAVVAQGVVIAIPEEGPE